MSMQNSFFRAALTGFGLRHPASANGNIDKFVCFVLVGVGVPPFLMVLGGLPIPPIPVILSDPVYVSKPMVLGVIYIALLAKTFPPVLGLRPSMEHG